MTYSARFDMIFPQLAALTATPKQIWIAALDWAGAITAEAPTTTNHAHRLVVARALTAQLMGKNDVAAYAQILAVELIYAPQLFVSFPGGLTSDADAMTLVSTYQNGLVLP